MSAERDSVQGATGYPALKDLSTAHVTLVVTVFYLYGFLIVNSYLSIWGLPSYALIRGKYIGASFAFVFLYGVPFLVGAAVIWLIRFRKPAGGTVKRIVLLIFLTWFGWVVVYDFMTADYFEPAGTMLMENFLRFWHVLFLGVFSAGLGWGVSPFLRMIHASPVVATLGELLLHLAMLCALAVNYGRISYPDVPPYMGGGMARSAVLILKSEGALRPSNNSQDPQRRESGASLDTLIAAIIERDDSFLYVVGCDRGQRSLRLLIPVDAVVGVRLGDHVDPREFSELLCGHSAVYPLQNTQILR